MVSENFRDHSFTGLKRKSCQTWLTEVFYEFKVRNNNRRRKYVVIVQVFVVFHDYLCVTQWFNIYFKNLLILYFKKKILKEK